MYTAYTPLFTIFSRCLGSIAAMYILMQERSLVQIVELSICVIICMMFNASILAQMKPKPVFNLYISSFLINLLFSITNFGYYNS